MIELKQNGLHISFPEVHPDAKMTLDFQRTLRIPDDGRTYPLPAGVGRFPCTHVDDFLETVPPKWMERGGIMLPMYQAEAMWINFDSNDIPGRDTPYPFAIKIAAGQINAVTGEPYQNALSQQPQDYMVSTQQPWLDGFAVERGLIRQFTAMPLGAGYTAEEQLTGDGQHGGLQVKVYPMKRQVFERRFPRRKSLPKSPQPTYSCAHQVLRGTSYLEPDMGLAMGGRMHQEICEDPFDFSDWDQDNTSRCFVHLANSLVWRQITGDEPPTTPLTPADYARYGLPWFSYYSESKALQGSQKLANLKSVAELNKETGRTPLPDNQSITPERIALIRKSLHKHEVRDSEF